MQIIRKNVKNYLLFVAYAALFLLVLVFGLFLLPDSLAVMTLFFITELKKAEITWAALLIFFCFMSYKFYRSIKCAENPRQAIRDNLKAHMIILLSISTISYVNMALEVNFSPAGYERCDLNPCCAKRCSLRL